MKGRNRTLVAIAGAAGLVGAGVAIARALREPEPEPDPDLSMPPEVLERTIPSYDGGTLRVVDNGVGRPLVLLHGITLGAEIWAYQLRDLADSYRVIAPDWRGHGGSIVGRDGYGLDRLAQDLATILTDLDLRGAVLVGHSMGGMALMRFLADHRDIVDERVAGVVFLSTSADPRMPRGMAVAARRLGAGVFVDGHSRIPIPAAADVITGLLPLSVFRRAFGRDPVPAHVAHTRSVMARTPALAAMSSGFGITAHDGRTALEATQLPSLVVVGTRDLLTPPAAARRIATHLPHGRLVEIDGGGHQLMLERRKELDALLRDFVDELGPSGRERET
jgi:pimeloyl-ACP methyl ester carboxylesterase